MNQDIKFHRLPSVRKNYAGGISVAALYSWMKKGLFPKPIKVSAGCALWRTEDLENWASTQSTGATK